jgi:hypothetical protein
MMTIKENNYVVVIIMGTAASYGATGRFAQRAHKRVANKLRSALRKEKGRVLITVMMASIVVVVTVVLGEKRSAKSSRSGGFAVVIRGIENARACHTVML